MNRHLNVFKTYTNANRTHQLENDLTRAFAICLQEDSLFLHEVLKYIFNSHKEDSINFYNVLFEAPEKEIEISIDIQNKASKLKDFEHIFAISLSESQMSDFWRQSNNVKYDPICDLIITIDNVLLVVEAKRDDVNCTSQLYNQIFNIIDKDVHPEEFNKENFGDLITPCDLTWFNLMTIAVKVANFEKITGNQNRFLNDFIQMVKGHNYRWLPESSISSLKPENNLAIRRRIESAIIELEKIDNDVYKLDNRLGINFSLPWAQEILFQINAKGDLIVLIYPGNTKDQGKYLFNKDPHFSSEIKILDGFYSIFKMYHVKFTSFQKWFTGLEFTDDDLKANLYTQHNFNYTGRKKRGNQWSQIEALFDNCFNESEYNWREYCNWNGKVINSGKNQFDISFGYQISFGIDFEKLKTLDTNQSDLSGLINLIKNIKVSLEKNLLM